MPLRFRPGLAALSIPFVLAACGGSLESRATALAEACWEKKGPAATGNDEIKDIKTTLDVRQVSDADKRNGVDWIADASFTFSAYGDDMMTGQKSWRNTFGSLAVVLRGETLSAESGNLGIKCVEGAE